MPICGLDACWAVSGSLIITTHRSGTNCGRTVRARAKSVNRSNSRAAAQRERLLPGAEAATASSSSKARMTAAAPLVRTFGAALHSVSARRAISLADRKALSVPWTSARQTARGKSGSPGAHVRPRGI